MRDQDKTKAQLLTELAELRQQVATCEAVKARYEQAETALRDSEKRYRAIYAMVRLMCDNVPDLIWAKDLEKRFIFVNQTMCETLLNAADTDEPIGKTDLYFAAREKMAHPDNPDWHTFGEICVDSDSIVLATQRPERFDEFGYVQGKFLFLDVHKAPFWDEQGQMIGTVGCGRIVTAERQLEEERRQRTAQLEALHEISMALTTELEVDALLQKIARRATELLGAQERGIFLYRPEREVLELVLSGSEEMERLGGTIFQRGEGLAGKVWETGQPVIVENYQGWPGRSAAFENRTLTTMLGVPIQWGQDFLGVLNVINRPTPFSPADAELLSLLASQAAVAIRNARLVGSLRESQQQYKALLAVECRQAQELALLDQVRMTVAGELDLATVLRTIVEAIAKTFGYTQVSIYLLRGEILKLQHQVGYGQVFDQIPISQGVCGRVVRTGRPELIKDVNADPDFMRAMERVVSEICVPLFDQDKVVGLFNIESAGGMGLDEADLRLMVALSEHINLAINRARLYTEARDSAERFCQLAENIHDVFWITSTDGLETVYVSPAYEKIWDRSVQSLIEQPYSWIDSLHPADRERAVSSFKAQDVTQPGLVEYRVVRPDGSTCWVRDRFFPIWDEAGRVYRRAGIAEDITERKRAEEAMRASEQRYRIVSDLTSDFAYVFRVDSENEVILEWITDAFSRITGFDPAELKTPQDWLKLVHPDDTSFIYGRFEQAVLKGQLVVNEFRIVTQNGETRWLRNSVRPIWDPGTRRVVNLYGAAQDITKRKKAEQALQQSEYRFRELAEKNAELYWEAWKRMQEQTALRKTAALISSSLDLPTVLSQIAEQMGQAIDVTSAHILGHNPEMTTGVTLAQYFSPEANPAEQISYQGVVYNLRRDLPSLLAFLQSDEPVCIFHADEPDWPEVERLQVEQLGLRSGLFFRLEIGNEILGSATLWESRRRRVFTIREIVLCQSIAQHAAIAIQHARLYTEAQQRLKEQTALLKAVTVLSSTLDLPVVLNHIAEQLAQAIDATSAYLCDYNPKALTSTVLAEYFSPQASATERVSDLHHSYNLPREFPGNYAFLQSDQMIQIEHVDNSSLPEPDLAHFQQFGAFTAMDVKLQVGGETIGYASLWESRRRREFTPAEMALCQGIAQQAALAINNARLLERARRDAETKETLLQEVNHRVKNNLAAIIGLLYAERRHEVGCESQPILEAIILDLINRVQSLATVHSLLSASSWAPLFLSELTEHVIDSARQTLPPEKQLYFQVSPSPVWVTPQQASNLALIINELTINTIKHALLERPRIQVMVEIYQIDNKVSFKFQDDGPGYPAEVLNLKQHNVGFYLIQNLVQKALRGEITLSNEPEPTVTIHFPVSGDLAALTENLE